MTIWSGRLRDELCDRSTPYATQAGVPYYLSRGKAGVRLFPASADGTTHGNFIAESFTAIMSRPSWRSRLEKSHTSRKIALPEPHSMTARELDSCTSSDALLMNVFCYPRVVTRKVAALLRISPNAAPEFGVPARVPLANGKTDATEIDMRLDGINIEAKLTEPDFTSQPKSLVERYEGLYEVFEPAFLPMAKGEYLSYQLIRNVMAIAHRPDARFHVLLDARRPDLLHEWWAVHAAIRQSAIRARCGFSTWQEIASVVPRGLRGFLALKYGL